MQKRIEKIDIPKKPYTTPRLVTYGQVRRLTQSGSGMNSENMAGQPTKKPSDRATKENIARIGSHPLGFDLYLFDYRPEYGHAWGHGRQLGVIAQEVESVVPEAVLFHADGYRLVNYTLLGITHGTQ